MISVGMRIVNRFQAPAVPIQNLPDFAARFLVAAAVDQAHVRLIQAKQPDLRRALYIEAVRSHLLQFVHPKFSSSLLSPCSPPVPANRGRFLCRHKTASAGRRVNCKTSITDFCKKYNKGLSKPKKRAILPVYCIPKRKTEGFGRTQNVGYCTLADSNQRHFRRRHRYAGCSPCIAGPHFLSTAFAGQPDQP